MYIDRKEWHIPEIFVEINMYQIVGVELKTTIERKIYFNNEIDAGQKEKLLIIASKCPISKLLENQIEIKTEM